MFSDQVNFGAQFEHEFTPNYKQLQQGLASAHIDKVSLRGMPGGQQVAAPNNLAHPAVPELIVTDR